MTDYDKRFKEVIEVLAQTDAQRAVNTLLIYLMASKMLEAEEVMALFSGARGEIATNPDFSVTAFDKQVEGFWDSYYRFKEED